MRQEPAAATLEGMLDEALRWLLELGERYGVNPIVYAVIYVGAAPFFFGSLAWLIRNLRTGRTLAVPLASTAFFFSAPTLYVFLAGRSLPAWVYAVLIGLAVIGVVMTVRRVWREMR